MHDNPFDEYTNNLEIDEEVMKPKETWLLNFHLYAISLFNLEIIMKFYNFSFCLFVKYK